MKFTVAVVQLDARANESHAERLSQIEGLLDGVHSELIVLPELWATGFFAFDRYPMDAEPLDGQTFDLLSAIAKRKNCWIVGGSLIECAKSGQLHNTALVLGPDGELAGHYRKIHVFGISSRERELVAPGATTTVVSLPWGMLGVSLCYDLRFPELYRDLVSKGAEIIAVSAAWPMVRRQAWELLLQARAVENQAFVIGCAGVGSDNGVVLGGGSMIIDPTGVVLARAGDLPETLSAEVDVAGLRSFRASFPVLKDRISWP